MVSMGARATGAADSARNDSGYTRYANLVGRSLTAVDDNGRRNTLKLIEVARPESRARAGAAHAPVKGFSLILRGDPGQPIAEGIYRFEGAGPSFEAFMSPILGDGKTYQIVFGSA